MIGAVVITEGADGAAAEGMVEEEEDELEEVVEDELEVVVVGGLMTVVVVEVVMDPFTHCPLTKISPNLLEQVLQPTPPSLKVNAYDEASHPPTQLLPLATNPLPQCAHTLLGITPTTIYTSENSFTILEAEMVRTKLLSMAEEKTRDWGERERRLRP